MSDKWVYFDTRFHILLGRFYVVWSIAELETSLLLGKLLGLDHEQTHMITTKMAFAVKTNLIRAIVKRRKPPNAGAVLGALARIQNQSLRNVFAHSLVMSSEKHVVFIDRSVQDGLTATKHEFTLEEFAAHVDALVAAVQDFGKAHAIPQSEIEAFAAAAYNLASKSKRSPDPPNSKA